MKLSIIIPAYNEEKTVKTIIDKVKKVNIGKIKKEIIVVDDSSKDKTNEILKKIKGIIVLRHKKNHGKGYAIRTGLKKSTGDLIVIQDADLEYTPSDYPRLLAPILKGTSEVVYGSRFKYNKGHLKESPITYSIHYAGNLFLTMMTNFIFLSNITDMETCYKVFTRNVLQKIGKLRAKKFDFEPEITAKILKSHFKIIEVPINYYSRDFKAGKKITWRDGIKALYYLIKYRIIN